MKLFRSLPVVLALALAMPFAAHAKKGKNNNDPNATPAPASANPVEALSPYIINLDGLLAIHRPPAKATQQFFAQSSGRIVVLRQEFAGELADASPEKKNFYTAAINTCDLINAALEERNKTAGDLKASGAVVASGKLEEQSRKDNLTQGIHSDGFGKAVGSIVERDREREANAKAAARANSNENALAAMAANQWNQRALAWRQKITASYEQIK